MPPESKPPAKALKDVLSAHRAPPWFEDAKLGIFVHWGLYSVPGWAPPLAGTGPLFTQIVDAMAAGRMPYAEWYLNSLRTPGSATEAYHRDHYGDAPYQAFREHFVTMLDGWRPEAWADLFASTGASYVVLTTKHSDGFLLWPSAHRHPTWPDWQLERDVVGELAAAVRARGLRFGVYYSGGLDWSFVSRPIVDLASVYSTVPTSPVYRTYAEAHLRELVARYRPSVLWNDISLPPGFPRDELLVHYLESVPDGVVNDRMRTVPAAIARALDRQPGRWLANTLGRRASAGGGAVRSVPYFADYATPEYTTESGIRAHKWETCRGFGHSFGYNRAETEEDLLAPTDIIRSLVDTAAKNGNLLLNVGPRGEDGVIPDAQADRLRALGSWMSTNREAVVGTRPWVRAEGVTDAGQPVRFTQGGGALYAILLDRPEAGPLAIRGVTTPGPTCVLGHGVVPGRTDGRDLMLEWPAG
ncbi:MAG TPA: alpha-L-fucosidase, partial [Acidimicrobiales bacterium]|nr:alpha-L-fucosidase [Acidimicrobiales bacterium]